MRVERTLLRDFIRFVEVRGEDGPIRAQWAVEWACALSARRGPGGAAQRLSMARGFLTYLRATIPETEVPDHALVASFRRPRPYLFTPDQISALMQDAQKMGPRGALRPHTLSTLIGLLASTGLRVGEARRLMITDVWLDNDTALSAHSRHEVPQVTTGAAASEYGRAPAPLRPSAQRSALRWLVRRVLCLRAGGTAQS